MPDSSKSLLVKFYRLRMFSSCPIVEVAPPPLRLEIGDGPASLQL